MALFFSLFAVLGAFAAGLLDGEDVIPVGKKFDAERDFIIDRYRLDKRFVGDRETTSSSRP